MEIKFMKLNDKEKFTINCGGIGKFNGLYPTPENCKKLRILNATEGMEGSINIELGKGINCFINAKNKEDEITKQLLMKILPIIQRKFIGKCLEDLLDFEFILTRRIN